MVVALQANYLEVELDQVLGSMPSRLLCTRRTRLRHRGVAVYVGDRVWVDAIDVNNARAVVVSIESRTSFLIRPLSPMPSRLWWYWLWISQLLIPTRPVVFC